jgi:protein MpaA
MNNRPLEIVEAQWGEALVLQLKGGFDANTSIAAQERLMALIEKGYIRLALDFSQVDYISSAGLRVLLTVLKKLKACRGKMVLFGFNDNLTQISSIAGLTALFSIHACVEEAREAFRWKDPAARFVKAARTGANCAAYCGETIDIDSLQKEIRLAAENRGWKAEQFLGDEGRELTAFSRVTGDATKSIYISSGMHGDEPAPPLAMLNLLWQDKWPRNWNIYLCPCLNPTGFRANTRANAEGIDLNRDYCRSQSREIQAHVDWLERQPPFSLTVSLHEDWESIGFYAYQLGQSSVESVMEEIMEAVTPFCAVDHSPKIDHLPAEDGVIDLAFHSLQANEKIIDSVAEGLLRPESKPQAFAIWSEPIFLINRKTKFSYTLETPSAFPLDVRVKGLVQVVNALLNSPYDFAP